MNPTRRDFLKTSLATGSLVAWGLTVPTFLSRTAAAAPTADKPGAKDTILVVDPAHRRQRRPQHGHPLQGRRVRQAAADAAHAGRTGQEDQRRRRPASVDDGPGRPARRTTPCASCRASATRIRASRTSARWTSGRPAALAETLTEGWIGKALKGLPAAPAFHLSRPTTKARRWPWPAPRCVCRRSRRWRTSSCRCAAASGADKKEQRALIEGAVQPGATRQAEPARFRAAHGRQHLRQQPAPAGDRQELPAQSRPIRTRRWPTGSSWRPSSSTPTSAPASSTSRSTASTRTPTRRPTHANLLEQLSDAMTAFYKDMAARGHQDRVLMMTFSEFGRRATENGSKGTDHGSAAPMLLVGGKVKAGVVGKHPSLTELEMGNLEASHRFPPGLRRHPRQLARRFQQGRARRSVPARGDPP